MEATITRITTPLDFEKDGKQFDYLHLPHSVHESGYGRILIPIVCVKNGAGPTVLLMAGNHGDEYEGQITLAKLAKSLEAEAIRGRVILLPMANYPAAKAGLRTSPIDGGNLNRLFPGNPEGSPTEQIAYYIEHVLMTKADFIVDLHCGGSSMSYIPSAIIVGGPEADGFDARLGLARAFGVPNILVFRTGGALTHLGGGAPGAALRQQRAFIAVEVGFGGTTRKKYIEMDERGVANILAHAGVMESAEPPGAGEPTILYSDTPECFVYCFDDGLFESAVELGDRVSAGDIAGWIHFPESPRKDPAEYRFKGAGTVINIGFRTLTKRGDLLFRLATAGGEGVG